MYSSFVSGSTSVLAGILKFFRSLLPSPINGLPICIRKSPVRVNFSTMLSCTRPLPIASSWCGSAAATLDAPRPFPPIQTLPLWSTSTP